MSPQEGPQGFLRRRLADGRVWAAVLVLGLLGLAAAVLAVLLGPGCAVAPVEEPPPILRPEEPGDVRPPVEQPDSAEAERLAGELLGLDVNGWAGVGAAGLVYAIRQLTRKRLTSGATRASEDAEHAARIAAQLDSRVRHLETISIEQNRIGKA